jgi:hypothetical protein
MQEGIHMTNQGTPEQTEVMAPLKRRKVRALENCFIPGFPFRLYWAKIMKLIPVV